MNNGNTGASDSGITITLNSSTSDSITYQDMNDVITAGSGTYDIGTITIPAPDDLFIGGAAGVTYSAGIYSTTTISNGINFGDFSITQYDRDSIKTSKGREIDLNDLAEVIDTVKRRLLILTPNFELHEKYPMLKEMYEEYKAMERLLGGPDSNIED